MLSYLSVEWGCVARYLPHSITMVLACHNTSRKKTETNIGRAQSAEAKWDLTLLLLLFGGGCHRCGSKCNSWGLRPGMIKVPFRKREDTV